MVACFEQQDYPNRELVVLDDAGQFDPYQEGPNWKLFSLPQRFRSIGEKINAAAALVSREVECYAKWDDDDVYLPWALSACVSAMYRGNWVQARHVLEFDKQDGFVRYETFDRARPNAMCYHGSWAFRRDVFKRIKGYPFNSGDEEYPFANDAGPSVDPISETFPDPYYVYVRHSNTAQFSRSGCDEAAYWRRGLEPVQFVGKLVPHMDRDYTAIPIPQEAQRRPW
jgi:hypothetical protein